MGLRNPRAVKLAVDIEPEQLHYVDSHGGWPLLTHFRGAEDRTAHRRGAIERAFEVFAAAETAGQPEPEIGGLGLLVLQRALLAAEDLGGLIHAMLGPDPWLRLRTAKIPDLNAAYELARTDPRAVLTAAFCLATDEQIEAEHSEPEAHAALKEARRLATRRWTEMLRRCASLWLALFNVAKATQHGFPIVAGERVTKPPGAGQLGQGVRSSTPRFAVAVTSRISGTEVTTNRQVVRLARHDVEAYRRNGKIAARLALELCQTQAESIVSGHVAAVPLRGTRFLNSEARSVIEGLRGDVGHGQ